MLFNHDCLAESVQQNLQQIEQDWAKAYYNMPIEQKTVTYKQLLIKTEQLLAQNPTNSDALFYFALIKSSIAEHETPLEALTMITEVHDILNKVIAINPKTMQGSAYVILGTLYYRVPAWPVSFGDNKQAEKMFQTALSINPDGIDSNYFYGQFLMENDKADLAKSYFEKAIAAPVRPLQPYADTQLKEQAKRALKEVLEQKLNEAKS